MPGDKERRFSRLTDKLLRRPSSSSAKNDPNQSATSSSSHDFHDQDDHASTQAHQRQLKQQRRRSRPQSSSYDSTLSSSPSSVAARQLYSTNTAASSTSTVKLKGKEPARKDTTETEETGSKDNTEEQNQEPSSQPLDLDSVAPDAATSRPRLGQRSSTDPDLEADSIAIQTRNFQLLKEGRLFRDFDTTAPADPTNNPPISPGTARPFKPRATRPQPGRALDVVDEKDRRESFSTPLSNPTAPLRPGLVPRRQSLVPASEQRLINSLLEPSTNTGGDYLSGSTTAIEPNMIHRRVWVKRPSASPTLVTITEDDLVDDLRVAVLNKYGNSLGRTYDSPDITLKLIPREPTSRQSHHERILGPEQVVGRTLDQFYPGGQAVEEALVIELPQGTTPKPSPLTHAAYGHVVGIHPGEVEGYFPPMPMIQAAGSMSGTGGPSLHQPSMSVLNTGQIPPIPSPGSRSSWQSQQQNQPRSRNPHKHATSPTVGSSSSTQPLTDTVNTAINGSAPSPSPPSTTTPPAPSVAPHESSKKAVVSPPSRASSPRPTQAGKVKGKSSSNTDTGTHPPPLPECTVPPIKVLIVEDNTINLKLLEAFMKRLKVRWQTALNGREAVTKWRSGGFHLVLMDIQLPVMSGLEATREIRRLERVNNIGVFSKTVTESSSETASIHRSSSTTSRSSLPETVHAEDKLANRSDFKSPVIIVALTASSLQSDRHEALAAGCNDFLTKPVNMMWLEQKVTEWGCMQALIDFEGWRVWRGFAASTSDSESFNSNGTTTQTAPVGTLAKRPHALSTVLWSNGESRVGSPTGRGRASSLSKKNGVSQGKDSSSSPSTVLPSHETQMPGAPYSGNRSTPTSANRRPNRTGTTSRSP